MEYSVDKYTVDEEKFFENLDKHISENDMFMGMTKYESFNKLSLSDKRKVTRKITDDCLKLGRNPKFNESVDTLSLVHNDFDNLPLGIQNRKVKEYISEALGE